MTRSYRNAPDLMAAFDKALGKGDAPPKPDLPAKTQEMITRAQVEALERALARRPPAPRLEPRWAPDIQKEAATEARAAAKEMRARLDEKSADMKRQFRQESADLKRRFRFEP